MRYILNLLSTVLIILVKSTLQENTHLQTFSESSLGKTIIEENHNEKKNLHKDNMPTAVVVEEKDVDESFKKLAKRLSHSKGAFIHEASQEDLHNDQKLRRSIVRKISIRAQSDVLKELLKIVEKSTEINLSHLRDLEHLVHQYEVALEFAKLDGIKLLLPYMTSSDDKIVSAVALLLGASMQGNPDVQMLAVKQEVGDILSTCLAQVNVNTCQHILFALSAYLRNMPEAQAIFFENNGLSLLSDILKNPAVSAKAKLKIVTLLHDLIVEHQMNKMDETFPTNEKYKNLVILLENHLKESEFCQQIPALLTLDSYDAHEKIIAAMKAFSSSCFKEFSKKYTIEKIQQLILLYNTTQRDNTINKYEIDEDLRQNLSYELKSLLDSIFNKNVTNDSIAYFQKKTEL